MPCAVYSFISLCRGRGIFIPGFLGCLAMSCLFPSVIIHPAAFSFLSISLRFIFLPFNLIKPRNITHVNNLKRGHHRHNSRYEAPMKAVVKRINEPLFPITCGNRGSSLILGKTIAIHRTFPTSKR